MLWPAGWYTFTEAFWGFVIGVSCGIAAALVLARFRPLGSALMPYFIAASAIPIIAFAPIANAWFGIEKSSKIFIAALLCFFPVLVNTLRGLTSVKPQQVELMRSYAAGNAAVFRRVRIPTSLPYVFTALKVASVLAMIGAIVGEYFGGSQQQLGIQIKNSAALFQFETAWAAILVACILGIGVLPGRVAGRDRDDAPVPVGANARGGEARIVSNAPPTRRAYEEVSDRRARGAGRRRVAALVFVSLGSAKPARSATADKVTLQLKWVPQAQFAGYYAAAAKGYYKQFGLDVTLKPGGPDITPEQVVASGQAQFGIDWLPSLLATRDKGGDLVNIAQVFTRRA